MKCNICKEKLIEVGYPVEGYQYYVCKNKCDFGNTLSWRFKNTVDEITSIIFICLLLILLSPLWIYNKIRENIVGE